MNTEQVYNVELNIKDRLSKSQLIQSEPYTYRQKSQLKSCQKPVIYLFYLPIYLYLIQESIGVDKRRSEYSVTPCSAH